MFKTLKMFKIFKMIPKKNSLATTFLYFLLLPAIAYGAGETYVLNFDINGTLMNQGDKAAGMTPEHCIQETLAKMPKYHGLWEDSQIDPDCYFDFLKRKYPDLTDRPTRNAELLKFHESFLAGSCFSAGSLPENIEALRVSITNDIEVVRRAMNSEAGNVLPSFFKLIEHLNTTGVKHHIVLRTFGHDLRDTAAEISRRLGVVFQFAAFEGGQLRKQILSEDGRLQEGDLLTLPLEIAEYLNKTPYLAVQDEWKPWNESGERREKGKPFYFSKLGSDVPLFFDDNIKEYNSHKNIISPVSVTGEIASPELTRHLYDTQLFPVNTREAILDEEYYIKLFSKAEKAIAP